MSIFEKRFRGGTSRDRVGHFSIVGSFRRARDAFQEKKKVVREKSCRNFRDLVEGDRRQGDRRGGDGGKKPDPLFLAAVSAVAEGRRNFHLSLSSFSFSKGAEARIAFPFFSFEFREEGPRKKEKGKKEETHKFLLAVSRHF